MLLGYARTSLLERAVSLEPQIASLAAAGCEKFYQERITVP